MRAMSGELGPVLRGHRRAGGLTLEELAESSGVSARAISDMERGHSRGPQSRTIVSLATALRLGPVERADLLAAAAAGRRRPPAAMPGWLVPADDPAFVGRAAELADVLRGLITLDGSGGVVVISGTGGLGKTALAVRVAYEVADDFPDGVIFVSLRGLDEDPVTTQHAAVRILNALGIRGRQVPVDPEQQVALLRVTLSRTRSLIVLDNAADESQVRNLLPRGGPSAALVTSRRTLSGLDEVTHTQLTPLSMPDSISLLSRILGSDHIGGHVPLQDLASVCGHFPLAIRIAANRLLSRPGWTVQTMVGRLSDTELRLDRLTAGDLRIQTAFAVSYDQLNPSERHAFRRLSMAHGPDWSLDAAAVLTDLPPSQVDRLLESLVELGLVNVSAAQRYSYHDLVRVFAGHLQAEHEPPQARIAADDRYRDWLLNTALQAGNLFEPDPTTFDLSFAASCIEFSDTAAAEQWLITEAESWLAAFREAARAGRHRTVIAIGESMHWFSDRHPHLGVWYEVFDYARNAARELGDLRLQAMHTNYLCWVYDAVLRNPGVALELAEEAFELAVRAEDLGQQAWSKQYSAATRRRICDLEKSLADALAAAELFKRSAVAGGRLQSLVICAVDALELGRYDYVEYTIEEILTILDDPQCLLPATIVDVTRISALLTDARCLSAQQQWDEADAKFRQALALTRNARLPNREIHVLQHYARMLAQCRRTDQARQYVLRSQQIAEDIDDFHGADRARSLLLDLVHPRPTSRPRVAPE